MRKAKVVRDFDAGAGPETFWFAEVKPGSWLEVNPEPVPEDEATILLIADGRVNDQGHRTFPILCVTRYLRMMADELEIRETLTTDNVGDEELRANRRQP